MAATTPKPQEDTWAMGPIGMPFPNNPVKVLGQSNMYVGLWYKHGKPVHGRAWNDGGVLQCSFPYKDVELTGKSQLGGYIQVLQYSGDHNKLGFWYEWIRYKDRLTLSDRRQLLKCGDSYPILWLDRPGGPLLGDLDNNIERGSFSHDGVSEVLDGPTLNDMWIIVRNFKGGPPTCTCEKCMKERQAGTKASSPTGGEKPPPGLLDNEQWLDANEGDEWPSKKVIMALDRPLNTVPGEEKEQYVALWFRKGRPIMGRGYKKDGKVHASFGDEGKEYNEKVGSMQMLTEIHDVVRDFDYCWVPYKDCCDPANGQYEPICVGTGTDRKVAPCVLTIDGQEILGQADMGKKEASASYGGKEHVIKGDAVDPQLVLCRKMKDNKAEEERLRKEKEEAEAAEALRKKQEEEARLKKEQEEAEALRKKQEEEARLKKEQEEAEALRKKQEEEARLKKEKEEAEAAALKKLKEEAEKLIPKNAARSEVGDKFEGLSLDTKIAISHAKVREKANPVTTPIYQSSTYRFDSIKQYQEPLHGNNYVYQRVGNPTVEQAEVTICEIEHGAGTVLYNSGLAAVSAVLLEFLSAGMHLIAMKPLYSGSLSFINETISRFGIEIDFIDVREENFVGKVQSSIKDNTKMLYVEIISNPLMRYVDLTELVKITKERKIFSVIDATFTSPYIVQPIKLGFDVVLHSCSKYIGGHSDVIAGCVTTARPEDWMRLKIQQCTTGSTCAPFDAYLISRGLKTLAIRVSQISDNALEIAKFLKAHSKVKNVWYVGLESDPGHEAAKKIMSKFGGMIAFEVQDGAAAQKFCEEVKLIPLAVSLGSTESLMEIPAAMTHSKEMLRGAHDANPIPEGLIRLSVGLESVADLTADIGNALDKI